MSNQRMVAVIMLLLLFSLVISNSSTYAQPDNYTVAYTGTAGPDSSTGDYNDTWDNLMTDYDGIKSTAGESYVILNFTIAPIERFGSFDYYVNFAAYNDDDDNAELWVYDWVAYDWVYLGEGGKGAGGWANGTVSGVQYCNGTELSIRATSTDSDGASGVAVIIAWLDIEAYSNPSGILRCKTFDYSAHPLLQYTDETTDANDADPSDVPLMEHYSESPEVNDAVYFGSSKRFYALVFDISTQGIGSWAMTWEYYNGSWIALSDVVDGTNGFLNNYGDGLNVTWTMPTDWELTTIDYDTYFWVRARVSSFVTVAFQPKADQIWRVLYPFIDYASQWSFNAAFIIMGLVMVPASTLYLVHGGKDSMSSNKLFYGLIAFFMGCALFIGGIMP